MMSEAELEALAADITANRLLEPIVVWEDNTKAAKGGEGPFPTYLLMAATGWLRSSSSGSPIRTMRLRAKGANYASGWAVKTYKALLATASGGASKPDNDGDVVRRDAFSKFTR
jgi:hypothetical protein